MMMMMMMKIQSVNLALEYFFVVATIFSYLGLWRFKLRTETVLACFLTARIATVSQASGLQKRAAVLREFAMNLFVGVK
jgi:hypothetical protein